MKHAFVSMVRADGIRGVVPRTGLLALVVTASCVHSSPATTIASANTGEGHESTASDRAASSSASPGTASASPSSETRSAASIAPSGPPPLTAGAFVFEPTVHAIGERAWLDAGIGLATDGQRFAVGWAVPSMRPHGPFDVAGALLDGTGERTQMFDAEEPDGAGATNLGVYRVIPVFNADGPPRLSLDRRYTADRQEHSACGTFEYTLPDPDNDEFPEFYSCRSVSASPSATLTLSPDSDDGRWFSGTVTAMVRTAVPDNCHAGSTIQVAESDLPVGEHPFRTALTRVLRNQYAFEDPEAVHVPERGWAAAFRVHGRIYFGWFGESGAPLTELTPVPVGHGTPGQPRVAWNGRQVGVVFALKARGRNTHYELQIARADPLGPIGAPVRVQTTTDTSADEFAPSLAGLPDGTWLMAWSRGPTRLTARTREPQQVQVRRYGSDFAPLADAALASADLSASDARLVVGGDRFVIAMLAGREGIRNVRTVSGRVGLGPAIPPLEPLPETAWMGPDHCHLATSSSSPPPSSHH